MSLQVFDYLIAGAGTAGCALAARLAEDPRVSVGLVEEGEAPSGLLGRLPLSGRALFADPLFARSHGDDGSTNSPLHSGRGLGGSAALGDGLWHLAQSEDLETWQAISDHWSPRAMLAAYQRAERAPHQSVPRGQAGPMVLERAGRFDDLTQNFIRAAHRGGLPIVGDLSLRAGTGVGRPDVAQSHGSKRSTAAAYLTPMPPNVTLLAGCKVQRVQFLGRRAMGLEVLRGGGWQTSFQARREVILSLGALTTPQILMLSGMGPGLILQRFDIPVIAALEGVGQGLFDQPQVTLAFGLNDPSLSTAGSLRLDRALWQAMLYATRKQGLAAASLWSATAAQALPTGAPLAIDFAPMALIPADQAASRSRLGQAARWLRPARWLFGHDRWAVPGFSLRVSLGQPKARGRVGLRSPDAAEPTHVDLGLLGDARDQEALQTAVAMARALTDQSPLARLTSGPLDPQLENASLREIVEPSHYYAATCRMGHEEDQHAVLDPDLRLRGVDGLRVVDASAFPDGISVPPLASVVMLAERAATLIRQDWR